MKNIIFIFSLPRSGSTLLQRMLAAHPQISTRAEPWLLLPLAYSLRESGVYAEYHHGHAARGISAFVAALPHQADDYYREIGRMAGMLYSKLAKDEAVYFLDKTPRYYLILPEIKKMFPDAKYIFLFRNPLQIYASMLETWYGGRLLMHGTHMDLFRGPKLLAAGYRDMREISIGVHFEELVNDPENTLRKLMDYLNLDYDPGCILDFHQIRFAGGLGDQTGLRQYSGIHQAPLEKWVGSIDTLVKKRHANQFLSFIGADDLNTLGYSKVALQKSITGLRTKKFGMSDLLWYLLSSLMRTFEPFMFIEKYKQKKRDGFPFTLHR